VGWDKLLAWKSLKQKAASQAAPRPLNLLFSTCVMECTPTPQKQQQHTTMSLATTTKSYSGFLAQNVFFLKRG